MSWSRRLSLQWPGLRRRWKSLKGVLLVAAVRGALRLLDLLTLEAALKLGERLGEVAYYLLRSSRRLALEHLKYAFGKQLSHSMRERIARAAFANFGRAFCEVAKIDTIRGRSAELFELEGDQHLETVLRSGQGCIAVTGHIGNWELLAAYFAWRGIPVSAVARRLYVPRLHRMVVEWRRKQGVETIVRESPDSARAILRVLKRNGVLAMLIDQDTHVPSISVPFFGRLARTPVAAAALAVRRELPVLPVFIQRNGSIGWRIRVRPPLYPDSSLAPAERVRELTKAINNALEQQIRANPAEWVWWHRRWRRGPMPNLDPDATFQYEAAAKLG
ncbi:MAG: lipid A biosynthesis acyltransferase [Candidatus Binatia bacterium]|nr:lipid A biosynthesis acyltransferase [Candidatus Binatia bacterium]